MLARFPLIGVLLALGGLLLVGIGVDRQSALMRGAGFIVSAIGMAAMGMHAIITRVYRAKPLPQAKLVYHGLGAQLRGGVWLVLAATALLAGYVEITRPDFLLTGAWRSLPGATTVVVLLCSVGVCLYGAALIVVRASDEGRGFVASLPQRILGILLVAGALATAIATVFMPGIIP